MAGTTTESIRPVDSLTKLSEHCVETRVAEVSELLSNPEVKVRKRHRK